MPEFAEFWIFTFLPELQGLIFKVMTFPNESVFRCTSTFLECHLKLCLKGVREGYLNCAKSIDEILTPDQGYYSNSSKKADLMNCPFGGEDYHDPEYVDWVSQLQPGDEVDAVKTSAYDLKIWSKARVTDIKGTGTCYVTFLGEKISNPEKMVKKSQFSTYRLGAYSEADFEWRENLAVGDKLDYYMHGRGWKLWAVQHVYEQFDSKDI